MNADQKSKDYSKIKDVFRPAHADYTYQQKYGARDYRGGVDLQRERQHAGCRGRGCQKVGKERYGVSVRGRLSALGPLRYQKQIGIWLKPTRSFVVMQRLIPLLGTT